MVEDCRILSPLWHSLHPRININIMRSEIYHFMKRKRSEELFPLPAAKKLSCTFSADESTILDGGKRMKACKPPVCLQVCFPGQIYNLLDFSRLLVLQYAPFLPSIEDLLVSNSFYNYLMSTLLVFPKSKEFFGVPPRLPKCGAPPFSFEKIGTMKDVVHNAIEQCLCNSSNSNNLLTFGFRKDADHSSWYIWLFIINNNLSLEGGQLPNTGNKIECFYPNTSLLCFYEPEWETFRSWIGDETMYFILTQCLLFSTVNNKAPKRNFVQFCGVPLPYFFLNRTLDVPLKKYNIPKLLQHPKKHQKKKRYRKRKRKQKSPVHKPNNPPPPLQNIKTNVKLKTTNWYDVVLPRHRIFYRNPRAICPKIFAISHFLNHPLTEEKTLFWKHVFYGSSKVSGLTFGVRQTFLQDLLYNAKRNHQKRVAHNIILQYHCPLSTEALQLLDHDITTVPKNFNYNQLTRHYTPFKQVSNFIFSVIQRTFKPLKIWLGSEGNINTFRDKLELFISLKRKDTLSIGKIMEGIKLNPCEWLACSSNGGKTFQDFQKRMMGSWLLFLFRDMIIPLLSTFFYCTESANHFNRIFYYRKSLWSFIDSLAARHFIGSMLEPITTKKVKYILSKRHFGYSQIRVLPKEKGVRPILNFGKKTVSKHQKGHNMFPVSINSVLKNLFQALVLETSNHPSLLQCSVLGLQDIYRSLLPFYQSWKGIAEDERKPLFFVSVDLKGCFDNINQQKLIQTIENVFSQEEYLIRKLIQVQTSHGLVRTNYIKRAYSPSAYAPFEQHCKNNHSSESNSIFIDQVVYSFISSNTLKEQLLEHVRNNIIKYGKYFYRQTKGIPQGSILSTLLCSIHFAQLDKQILASQIPLKTSSHGDSGVLLRLIDDFLYITTSKSAAMKFSSIMDKPNEEFGFRVNSSKTKENFTSPLRTLVWCGLQISTESLAISPSYFRYAGTLISDTITEIGYKQQAGARLRRMLIQHLKPKCHLLLLDEQLSSHDIVLQNIYQIITFVAIKFHVYCHSLSHTNNLSFLWNSITDVVMKMNQFVKVKVKGKEAQKFNCLSTVKSNEIIWLGYYAFFLICKRKQNQYPKLLHAIQLHLCKHSCVNKNHLISLTKAPHIVAMSDDMLF